MAFNNKKLWKEWITAKAKDFDNIRVRDNKSDEMPIYPKGKALPIHYPVRITKGGTNVYSN